MEERAQLEKDVLKLVLQSNLNAGDAIVALKQVQHQIALRRNRGSVVEVALHN